jgi:hypothetical protein
MPRIFPAIATLMILAFSFPRSEAADVVSLLRSGDFRQLESQLSKAQQGFEKGELTEYELRNAFRPFYRLDEVADKNLQDWVERSPKSYVAHLALGIRYKRMGGEARGGAYISETPPARLKESRRLNDLSETELRRSMALTEKPYLSIFHLMSIMGDRGDRNSLSLLLLQGNKILPSNALVRNRYCMFLVPRWGGSYEDVDNFIARSRRQGAPASVILQLRAIELEDKGLTLMERRDPIAANELFEKALQLGKEIGGTFTEENLGRTWEYLCKSQKKSPNC